MARRWRQSIAVFALALFLGATSLAAGNAGSAVGWFLFFAVLALLVSPLAFPKSVTDAEARARSAQDGRAIVYWRPGCPFCMRLRASLGRHADSCRPGGRFCMRLRPWLGPQADRLHWGDFGADPAGAASVRAVADGN